jgi:FKBP-type peptidyl-prolyl cis-trans isomerase
MMRKWIVFLAVAHMVALASAEETQVLKTYEDQMSYVLGVDLARNIKRQGVECDLDFVIKGLQDGFSGKKLLISEMDFRQILVELQTAVRQKAALTRGRPQAEINKKKGEMFLAENESKEGVVTLPSGLQYRILKEGHGQKPKDTDTVECNYRGTLLDGAEFICSNPGQPAILKIKEADIAGMAEVLQLMPVGSKWQLFIPPQLAYGVRGVGDAVGPNTTLIFEVELVAIR